MFEPLAISTWSEHALGPPLDGAEFDRLMAPLGPWGAERRVAVAVSGGADSTCLCWLAARWGRPLAMIVDHGLRPESGAEAAGAASRLANFGVASRIVRLHGLARGAGIAARARSARYAALTRMAAAEGLTDLLLGHHARDQAETLLIRGSAGSGPSGLAGMAPIVETASLRLVRPLLGIPPGRLRTTLRAQGLGWAEDPSNADPASQRARVRAGLTDDSGEAPLVAEAVRRAASRTARHACIAATLARRASLFPEGYALLTPGPIAPDCLAALIRALTGADYAPGGRSLARLAADPCSGTLGGVRLLPAGRLGPGTLMVREAAAMQGPMQARSGAIWDGRFVLHAAGPLPGEATVAAFGDDSPKIRSRTSLPDAVIRCLPALRAPGQPLAVPHLGQLNGWTKCGLRLTLRPANPVCGAPFFLGDAQRAQASHVIEDATAAHAGLPQ